MTVEWIVGIFIGLLIAIAGYFMKLTMSKMDKRIDANFRDLSQIKEKIPTFVDINKCDKRKAVNDKKLDDVYTHQNSSFELLRRDIKDLGKEIKEDVTRHMDDHLKAYHK